MKDNKLDQLINSAFGELSADQTKELMSSLSAAESKELAELSLMRSAFDSLPDPGDCQVSPEMMRDRILGAGAAMRKPLQWKWFALALPAVAGAFFAVSFMNNPKVAETVQSPVKIATVTVPPPDEVEPQPQSILDNSTPDVRSDGDPVKPVAEEEVRKDLPQKRAKHKRQIVESGPSVSAPVVSPKAETTPTGGNSEILRAPAPAPKYDSVAMKSSSPETVVVITEGPDGPAGAQVAEEVNSSSDVIING